MKLVRELLAQTTTSKFVESVIICEVPCAEIFAWWPPPLPLSAIAESRG
jgi:hypothetical protein